MLEAIRYRGPGEESEMSPEEMLEYLLLQEMFGSEGEYIIKKKNIPKDEDNGVLDNDPTDSG